MTNTAIIDLLIERADAHQAADEYAQGHYNWNGKACSIGCAVRDLVLAGHLPSGANPRGHAAIAEQTGIPEQMLHLNDRFFESCPKDEAPAWSGRFFRACRGRDLSLAWQRYMLWLLSDERSPMHGAAQRESVRDAVGRVADLYREWVETGTKPGDEKWRAARAAWAAARAARAAEAAAWRRSAGSATAAWSAWPAAAAWAEAACPAAEEVGGASWRTMREEFIAIIEACPAVDQ